VARLVAPVGADAAEIVLSPPATLLFDIAARLAGTGIGLGAQDCHARGSGAFTGDLSAAMLADAGCSHVIVGHSERRAYHHETSDEVRAKAEAALEQRLVAIICVGETEAERDAGTALELVGAQIAGSVPGRAAPETVVVAYEPVWAIGTGRVASAADVAEMHRHIRRLLADRFREGAAIRILYGGSVKPSNAAELLSLADVDGALVGGASLHAADFAAIVRAAPGR
jgi:triosephosphate isomerase